MNIKNYKHKNFNIYVLSDKDIFSSVIQYFKTYHRIDILYKVGGFFDEYYAEFIVDEIPFILEYNIWFGTELKTQDSLSAQNQIVCISILEKLNAFLQNPTQ